MVTHFAPHMPSPRFGVGHSMGGQCIFECALRNPTLFTAIVGIDPIIEKPNKRFFDPVSYLIAASSRRWDMWASQSEAEEFFRSRPFWKAWDPRVVDAQIKYGLRPLPTHIYPTPSGGVTLTTTKHQETFQLHHPDPANPHLLSRPEPVHTFSRLHLLTLPILYIFGSTSYVSNDRAKQSQTPHAEEVVIPDTGHTIPQEKPRECAIAVAEFVGRMARKWEKQREEEGRRGPPAQVITREFLARLSKL